jgi:hypothetical protein
VSALVLEYDRDLWLRLDGDAVEPGQLATRLESAPADWSQEELVGIIGRALSAPTFAADAERFLLVAEDRSWYVLEVSLLSDDREAPLDPAADFDGLTPEPVQVSATLSGYRLVTVESAGPLQGLPGPASDVLIPRVHYFLEVADDSAWLYASVQVPDPLDLPVIVPLVEELLAGAGREQGTEAHRQP